MGRRRYRVLSSRRSSTSPSWNCPTRSCTRSPASSPRSPPISGHASGRLGEAVDITGQCPLHPNFIRVYPRSLDHYRERAEDARWRRLDRKWRARQRELGRGARVMFFLLLVHLRSGMSLPLSPRLGRSSPLTPGVTEIDGTLSYSAFPTDQILTENEPIAVDAEAVLSSASPDHGCILQLDSGQL